MTTRRRRSSANSTTVVPLYYQLRCWYINKVSNKERPILGDDFTVLLILVGFITPYIATSYAPTVPAFNVLL